MNSDNNAPNPSNPPGTNQFEGISMVDSTFIPQRSNNRAQLGDNNDQGRGSASFGAGFGLQENALSEVRGRDSQIDQRDMSVAQIQQDVGRKLRMRIASDDFENKILQSADLGETIDMLKKLVREANLNGEAENDILDDLDNLKDNLSAAGIDVSDKGAGQLLIQKTFYETQIEIKRSEQEKVIDNDFELAQQMKKIEEDIELIDDNIKEQKRNSDREKGILEIKIAQLKNELQSLQTFEVSLNNLVKDMEDAKNKDGDENNRIKSEIDRLKKEQERIVNSLKEARNQRKEAKEREYEASQEIEELQEKLNSLKDLEASLEEIMKQIEKIALKIQEGEENIGELNKKCKEAKKLYEEERRKFEQEKNSQDIQRKDLEKQKEEIERIVKENEEQESEKSPTSLAEAAQRREEERALLEAKIKSANETEKELNQKEERYSKWREDLQSRKDESKRLYDIKEELKQSIEEAKAIEGAYLNLEKEYQIQKQVQDEVVLNFQVQRKEKLKELNQKLEDAKNELNWKQKRRTGAFANFCVAFINTGIVGLLVLAFLYVSKIDIPGVELV